MRPPIGARIVRGLGMLHASVELRDLEPLYKDQGSFLLEANNYLDADEKDDVRAALDYIAELIVWYDGK